jgi:hypothetical protein
MRISFRTESNAAGGGASQLALYLRDGPERHGEDDHVGASGGLGTPSVTPPLLPFESIYKTVAPGRSDVK